MRLRSVFYLIFAGFLALGVVHAQKPFRDYSDQGAERESPLPSDWNQPAEFVRARLKYTKVGILHPGHDTSTWGWLTDYPDGDRHFLQGLRRLTTIDARSVEQVVSLDDLNDPDDLYNWPFLYGVELGHLHLDDEEALQLRDYLDRGGFLMTDDFHGTIEWENFASQIRKVYPLRKIVDIANDDPIFHVMFDLKDRVQIPGAQSLYYPFLPYEFDGFEPKWRAIYDDRNRIIMAICHNMDISDAIEWSDNIRYPEESANLAYRIAVNYVLYDLTH